MSRHKPVGRLSTEAEASQVALEVGRSQEALSVPKVSEIACGRVSTRKKQ